MKIIYLILLIVSFKAISFYSLFLCNSLQQPCRSQKQPRRSLGQCHVLSQAPNTSIMPWTSPLSNPHGPRHPLKHRNDHSTLETHVIPFSSCSATLRIGRNKSQYSFSQEFSCPALVKPWEDTHPVVKLGTAIILGWQVEDGVVVRMPGIQERPYIFDVVPEAQLNAFSRKRHH